MPSVEWAACESDEGEGGRRQTPSPHQHYRPDHLDHTRFAVD